MEPAGWLLLIVSWTTLSVLVSYCLRRTLRGEEAPGRSSSEEEERSA